MILKTKYKINLYFILDSTKDSEPEEPEQVREMIEVSKKVE